LDDVVLSEILWRHQSLMSGVACCGDLAAGLSHSLMSLWMIPLALLIAAFASLVSS